MHQELTKKEPNPTLEVVVSENGYIEVDETGHVDILDRSTGKISKMLYDECIAANLLADPTQEEKNNSNFHIDRASGKRNFQIFDERQTSKLFSLYDEHQEKLGRSVEFPTKVSLWTFIANQINKEFNTSFTVSQVENRHRNILIREQRMKEKNQNKTCTSTNRKRVAVDNVSQNYGNHKREAMDYSTSEHSLEFSLYRKNAQTWTQPRIKRVMELYAEYEDDIPVKKDLYLLIARKINNEFNTSFTAVQIDRRYNATAAKFNKFKNRKRKNVAEAAQLVNTALDEMGETSGSSHHSQDKTVSLSTYEISDSGAEGNSTQSKDNCCQGHAETIKIMQTMVGLVTSTLNKVCSSLDKINSNLDKVSKKLDKMK